MTGPVDEALTHRQQLTNNAKGADPLAPQAAICLRFTSNHIRENWMDRSSPALLRKPGNLSPDSHLR